MVSEELAKVFANDDYGLLSKPAAYVGAQLRHGIEARWYGGEYIDLGSKVDGRFSAYDVINVWDYRTGKSRYPFTPEGLEAAIASRFIWTFAVYRTDTEEIETYFAGSRDQAAAHIERLSGIDYYATENHNLRGDFPEHLSDDIYAVCDSLSGRVYWIDAKDAMHTVESVEALEALIG